MGNCVEIACICKHVANQRV